ncbi:MAG: hypothetical protein GY928_24480 [Colwellia sp.]|nr:hypothetical protein [Colwellia sp.]
MATELNPMEQKIIDTFLEVGNVPAQYFKVKELHSSECKRAYEAFNCPRGLIGKNNLS